MQAGHSVRNPHFICGVSQMPAMLMSVCLPWAAGGFLSPHWTLFPASFLSSRKKHTSINPFIKRRLLNVKPVLRKSKIHLGQQRSDKQHSPIFSRVYN